MKRIIPVALALVMIFALTVSVAAVDSPVGDKFYAISVDYELADGSLGTAAADKTEVSKEATGDDAKITLTATEADGFFTLWMIDGDYEVVEGDESSPVMVIIPKSDIHATASFSVDEEYLTMTVSTVGDGTATVNPARVKKGSGDTVVFQATDGNDTFQKWTLDCKYDIVEGSLTSRKLVIRPYTDVHGTAYFVNGQEPTTPSATEKPGSGSSTSPKTGDPLFFVLGFAVLALGASVLAVKKIKE